MSSTTYAHLVLCAAAAILVGCNNPAPNAGRPTRQAVSMQRMQANVESLRGYTAGKLGQPEAEQAANELVTWSNELQALFPPAEATLYADFSPAMARDAPGPMLATATRLREAVRTGQLGAAAGFLTATEKDGCGACHRTAYP